MQASLEETKEKVLTEEHRVKYDRMEVKALDIQKQETEEKPKEKRKKKRNREKTPEIQQQDEVQEQTVKIEEDPPKVKKKKRKHQPDDEPNQPTLEQTSAFALTEINSATPINN